MSPPEEKPPLNNHIMPPPTPIQTHQIPKKKSKKHQVIEERVIDEAIWPHPFTETKIH
jgi:hypothetical protein